MDEHTAAPWRQGVFLDLAGYERMSEKWKQKQIEREQLQVFANFHTRDHGRSRKLVAQVQTQEDARRIVACVNALAGFSTEEIEKGKAAGIIRHRKDAGETDG